MTAPQTTTTKVTTQALLALKAKLHPELHAEQWYTILAAASASAHIGDEALPLLYRAIVSASTPDAEAIRIQRRLKESLIKCSVLAGIPVTLDSTFALLGAVREDNVAHPGRNDAGFFAREGLDIEDVRERGMEHVRMIYRHNFDEIEHKRFARDMEDIKKLTLDVNYGWNLSETSVLDLPSTELVVLSSLIPQNLRPETLWHLRGCRRMGWSDDVINSVRDVCIDLCRDLAERRTDKIPRLDEVKETSND